MGRLLAAISLGRIISRVARSLPDPCNSIYRDVSQRLSSSISSPIHLSVHFFGFPINWSRDHIVSKFESYGIMFMVSKKVLKVCVFYYCVL